MNKQRDTWREDEGEIVGDAWCEKDWYSDAGPGTDWEGVGNGGVLRKRRMSCMFRCGEIMGMCGGGR